MKKLLNVRLISLLLSVLMLGISLCSCNDNDDEGGFLGIGKEKYTEIHTAKDLEFMNSSGNYRLMNDIDLSECTDWTPKIFNGTLDGNGYRILNININIVSPYDESSAYAGLFQELSGAKIMNLGIEGGTVHAESSSGVMYVGAFAAIAKDTEFINCYNTATVSTKVIENGGTSLHCNSMIGGFVGMGYADFTNCYNAGTVQAASNAYADSYVSGFIGRTSVSSQTSVTVKNSYNVGEIKYKHLAGSKVGGVLGYPFGDNITMENVYYSTEASYSGVKNAVQETKDSEFTNVLGFTAEQMKNKSNYAGFDFDETWAISSNTNNGYPHLKVFDK